MVILEHRLAQHLIQNGEGGMAWAVEIALSVSCSSIVVSGIFRAEFSKKQSVIVGGVEVVVSETQRKRGAETGGYRNVRRIAAMIWNTLRLYSNLSLRALHRRESP